MRVYVDESGDTGTNGKGSRWLVFGCVLVSKDHDTEVRRTLEDAETNLKQRGKKWKIHFSNYKHTDKIGVLNLLCACDWHAIVVASDTTKIKDGSQLENPTSHYNYALRYAIERITRYAKDLNERIDELIIEQRGNFKIDDFRQYLTVLKTHEHYGIEWDYLEPSAVMTKYKTEEALLRYSDGVANAVYKALEPDHEWGICELAYLRMVNDKLWANPIDGQTVYNFGLTLMPTAIKHEFAREYTWLSDMGLTG